VGRQVGKVLEVKGKKCAVQIWQKIQEFEIRELAPVDSDKISFPISQEDYLFLLTLGVSSLHEAIEMLQSGTSKRK
jgi:hypothetical protein